MLKTFLTVTSLLLACSPGPDNSPPATTQPAPQATPPASDTPNTAAPIQIKKKESPEGVADFTDDWQKQFGLDGKIKITNGKRDTRPTWSDGPIKYGFDTQLTQQGNYGFTFALMDNHGVAYQVHTVRVCVIKQKGDAPIRRVSPDTTSRQAIVYVELNEMFRVDWEAWNGKVRGGWTLQHVSFTSDPKAPLPGVPGYAAATPTDESLYIPYKISQDQAYTIAYEAIAKKANYVPPGRDKAKWSLTLQYSKDTNPPHPFWVVGVDFAPAGGGDHASAMIDAITGEVLSAGIGHHGR